ncbi:MAG TPA: ATP-binding protein [Thermoanaerobaculia bacterium]|nr:ATP-binding protein [Thermoanaerobaculia bacterium]
MALDFQRLFESAPSLYLVLDRDFRIVAVTDAYLTATMTSRGIIGQALFDVFPDNPEDPDASGTRNLRTSLETVLRTGEANTMPRQKYDIRRPDDEGGGFEERYWSPVNSPVFSGGKLTHIVHRAEDVTEFVRLQQRESKGQEVNDDLHERTESMRAELYLRAQEGDEQKLHGTVATVGKLGLIPRANLYLLLMNAPAAVCIVRGGNQFIELANGPFRRLTGKKEILGQPARDVLRSAELLEPIDAVRRTGQPAVAEQITLPCDDDGLCTFRFVFQPMYNNEGAVDGVVLFGSDVTDQVEARRKLEGVADDLKRADRAKDEFIAIISHELRTPMTSILGWARMLELGALDEQTYQEAVNAITRSTRAQAKLIEDLLDESRIASGKLRLDLRPLELNTVVDAAVTMVRPAAELQQISIATEASDGPLPVSADPVRIQQVIGNILSNALKFVPEGGQVIIRLAREETNAVLQIRDTGRGMSETFLPYVFDRFRQGGGGGSERHEGLGLGMAIARHLVEMHDGTISASSEGEGRGSTFTIQLPLQDVAATEFSEREQGRDATFPRLDRLRVLIIEDEVDNRTVLSTVMKQCGAEVQSLATALAAFPVIASWKPDVLISDIDLPDLDGCAFMKQLRSSTQDEGSETPALALTVLSRPDERARIREAGFNVFREKPIDPVDLAYEVERLANSRGSER